jgi:hypothetical protein
MSQWAEFLRKLNPDGQRALEALWRMSDGKTLRINIPAAELIADEELTADLEFGYKLYETLELEFSSGDFDEIEQAARTSGLIYRRKPDRIIIRSPYTC